MGYPAFNLTAEQLVSLESESTADSQSLLALSESARADLNRWRGLSVALRREILEQMKGYQAPKSGELDGPCSWFDAQSRLCQHHEFRPQVCREFQVGSRGCLDWRQAKSAWLGVG